MNTTTPTTFAMRVVEGARINHAVYSTNIPIRGFTYRSYCGVSVHILSGLFEPGDEDNCTACERILRGEKGDV